MGRGGGGSKYSNEDDNLIDTRENVDGVVLANLWSATELRRIKKHVAKQHAKK